VTTTDPLVPAPEAPAADPKPRRRWWLRGIVLPLVVVLVGAAALAGVVVQVVTSVAGYVVNGDAMLPTAGPTDHLVVRRDATDPHRGDLVMLVQPASWGSYAGRLVLRRVVAVGGDTVSCCDSVGRLQVDDRSVVEDYLRNPPFSGTAPSFTLKVPAGTVYVLGDWRENALDSRQFRTTGDNGAVPLADLRGTVVSINGHRVQPTHAFTNAGLPGEPYREPGLVLRGLVLLGGGLLALGGLTWLLVEVLVHARRTRRRPG
jgi:signal peptidase I